MPAPERSSITPQQIAEFQKGQQIRAGLVRKLAAILQVWRDCDKPACRRARACLQEQICAGAAIRARMTDEDRAIGQAAITMIVAGVPKAEAFATARARYDAMRREMQEELSPR